MDKTLELIEKVCDLMHRQRAHELEVTLDGVKIHIALTPSGAPVAQQKNPQAAAGEQKPLGQVAFPTNFTDEQMMFYSSQGSLPLPIPNPEFPPIEGLPSTALGEPKKG